jgi:transcriptional regulator with XRE-family HTH domain
MSKDDFMTLGERLKQLRKENSLTQEQFAKKLGATRGALSNWEIDNSTPDNDMLIKIADFFDVTTDYLLGKNKDVNPLEKFISDYKILSKEDKKEAIKRLVDQALEMDKK